MIEHTERQDSSMDTNSADSVNPVNSADCAVCLRLMPLRRDGKIRVHGPIGNRCQGSGIPPQSSDDIQCTANKTTDFEFLSRSIFSIKFKILKRIPRSRCSMPGGKKISGYLIPCFIRQLQICMDQSLPMGSCERRSSPKSSQSRYQGSQRW